MEINSNVFKQFKYILNVLKQWQLQDLTGGSLGWQILSMEDQLLFINLD